MLEKYTDFDVRCTYNFSFSLAYTTKIIKRERERSRNSNLWRDHEI